MYLQYQASKKGTDIMQNVLFYLLWILYLLSIITIAGDITDFILTVSNNSAYDNENIFSLGLVMQYLDTRPHSVSLLLNLLFLQITITGLCDFLAQIILVSTVNYPYHAFYSLKSSKIYRCWLVWGRNIPVIILPSFFSITFLGEST